MYRLNLNMLSMYVMLSVLGFIYRNMESSVQYNNSTFIDR